LLYKTCGEVALFGNFLRERFTSNNPTLIAIITVKIDKINIISAIAHFNHIDLAYRQNRQMKEA